MSNKYPRYLSNVSETSGEEEVKFSGVLPPYLNGILYSNSPGLFHLSPTFSLGNWFDGYSILSKLVFTPGKNTITFSSRYLDTTALKKAKEQGVPSYPEVGTSGQKVKGSTSIFQKLRPFTPSDLTDNTMGPLWVLGDSLFTAGDSCYLHEIDGGTLQPLRKYNVYQTLGLQSICPQPVEDVDGRESYYFLGGSMSPTLRYTIMELPKSELASPKAPSLPNYKSFRTVCNLPSRWIQGGYPFRNFKVTKNYILLVECPMVLNVLKFSATYAKSYRMKDWLDWRPQDGARFLLIRKSDGQVEKEVMVKDPFFTTGILNVWEDPSGDFLGVDLISMPDMTCNNATDIENIVKGSVLAEGKAGSIQRFRIPVKKGNNNNKESCTLVELPLSVTPCGMGADFCTFNPLRKGKKIKYFYITSGLMSISFSPYAYSIVKIDADHGKEVGRWCGKNENDNLLPSEPVFIPGGEDNKEGSEDSGVLLTVVKSGKLTTKDFILLLDPKTMKEVGRAEFKSDIAGWFKTVYISTKQK